ncbi:putative membrane protein [Sphaerochaeta pleomorpha str. Grapes]|uniref:Putative membrane protein n=1 Tax=Sphaerochaeta pleomorpha (strain ATCC BAA-1885 / DSM 22778 / Grapes) TaxID=158190 RepID=G8QRY4_SPHPG|nr:YihY/virulence factor BrkB family protein [Sphaerochaeta pleomorpha]AEV29982.1 putative membrane protein [Sphaerochaeta pleomorpha str. Grapes]
MGILKAIKGKFASAGNIASLAMNQAMHDNVFQSASSMVYSTLMAIVPGLTFIFTFFGAFGVLQPVIDFLAQWFTEIFGPEAGTQLLSLLEKYTANATSLGVVGLISFLITMVLLINKVWSVINQIFRTSQNRNPVKRFAGFVTFLIISCLLAAAYVSVQSLMNSWYSKLLGVSVEGWSKVIGIAVPLLIIWAIFFLLAYFVPNIKVHFSSAGIGAFVGMLLIMGFSKIMSKLTGMATNFSVIYGSLAAVFLFLFWCYYFWTVVFYCVELTYVHQFRPDKQVYKGLPQSPALQLSEGANIMMLIGSNFHNGNGGTTTKEIIERLAIPANRLYGFLELLSRLGFITPTNNGNTEFIPKQPLENMKVLDLVTSLYGLENMSSDEHNTVGEAIALQVKDHGIASLGSLTIENLLQRI